MLGKKNKGNVVKIDDANKALLLTVKNLQEQMSATLRIVGMMAQRMEILENKVKELEKDYGDMAEDIDDIATAIEEIDEYIAEE